MERCLDKVPERDGTRTTTPSIPSISSQLNTPENLTPRHVSTKAVTEPRSQDSPSSSKPVPKSDIISDKEHDNVELANTGVSLKKQPAQSRLGPLGTVTGGRTSHSTESNTTNTASHTAAVASQPDTTFVTTRSSTQHAINLDVNSGRAREQLRETLQSFQQDMNRAAQLSDNKRGRHMGFQAKDQQPHSIFDANHSQPRSEEPGGVGQSGARADMLSSHKVGDLGDSASANDSSRDSYVRKDVLSRREHCRSTEPEPGRRGYRYTSLRKALSTDRLNDAEWNTLQVYNHPSHDLDDSLLNSTWDGAAKLTDSIFNSLPRKRSPRKYNPPPEKLDSASSSRSATPADTDPHSVLASGGRYGKLTEGVSDYSNLRLNLKGLDAQFDQHGHLKQPLNIDGLPPKEGSLPHRLQRPVPRQPPVGGSTPY